MTDASGKGGRQAVPELTAPDYVVLGMVRLGARSGYEIKQRVERSIRFFWTISQVQIYPSLRRLAQAGLIAGTDDPQGKRPRRTYAITGAGEAALRQWLHQADPMPFELRDTGLVRLYFADALPSGEASELLTVIKQRSQEKLAALREIESSAATARNKGDIYPLLTLQMGIGFHQAIIDVCQDFERS